jgi:hypothetical protein
VTSDRLQRRIERLLDRAGDLFSRHGAKLYHEQVLAKTEVLKT